MTPQDRIRQYATTQVNGQPVVPYGRGVIAQNFKPNLGKTASASDYMPKNSSMQTPMPDYRPQLPSTPQTPMSSYSQSPDIALISLLLRLFQGSSNPLL